MFQRPKDWPWDSTCVAPHARKSHSSAPTAWGQSSICTSTATVSESQTAPFHPHHSRASCLNQCTHLLRSTLGRPHHYPAFPGGGVRDHCPGHLARALPCSVAHLEGGTRLCGC